MLWEEALVGLEWSSEGGKSGADLKSGWGEEAEGPSRKAAEAE